MAAAGVDPLAALWIAVSRAGLHLAIKAPALSADMRRLVRLGLPGVISGGVTQINIVIGTVIASLQAGAVSYLYYADRLYQLPLGIVGVAIGIVLLPDLARNLRAGNHALGDGQPEPLRRVRPVAHAAGGRGAGRRRRTDHSRPVRAGRLHGVRYAADCGSAGGLRVRPALFVLIKVFQPAYFAREDTRTPMRYAVWNMLLNVAGSIALFFTFQRVGFMPHVGIAIATTLVRLGQRLSVLVRLSSKRDHFKADDRLRRNVSMIALASLGMGAAIWLLVVLLPARPSLRYGDCGAQAVALAPCADGGTCGLCARHPDGRRHALGRFPSAPGAARALKP